MAHIYNFVFKCSHLWDGNFVCNSDFTLNLHPNRLSEIKDINRILLPKVSEKEYSTMSREGYELI